MHFHNAWLFLCFNFHARKSYYLYLNYIIMDDANTIDTSSLLLARGFGNNGYGFGNGNGLGAGNSVLSAEAHANGTATKEAIDCNSTRFSDGLNKITSDFENQTRASQIEGVNKNITDAEFRGADRQRDIERMLVDNAKEAAKCCCDAKIQAMEIGGETQKLILAEGTKTRELILAVEGRANVRLLDAANAKITQLETINALSGRP